MTHTADKETLIQVGWWHHWGHNRGRFYYLNESVPYATSLLGVYIDPSEPSRSIRFVPVAHNGSSGAA